MSGATTALLSDVLLEARAGFVDVGRPSCQGEQTSQRLITLTGRGCARGELNPHTLSGTGT